MKKKTYAQPLASVFVFSSSVMQNLTDGGSLGSSTMSAPVRKLYV